MGVKHKPFSVDLEGVALTRHAISWKPYPTRENTVTPVLILTFELPAGGVNDFLGWLGPMAQLAATGNLFKLTIANPQTVLPLERPSAP